MNATLLPMLVAGVLTLAAVLASVRVWQGRAGRTRWHTALLLGLQPVLAVLLFFGLFPPMRAVPEGRALIVLTTGWRDAPDAGQPGLRIALPEAEHATDAEPSPDLASALRRYPYITYLHVLGDGLSARDREAARGHAITFRPPALPAGLVELAYPARLGVGNRLQVHGRAAGIPHGQVELLDPALQRVQRIPLRQDGQFTLQADVRSAGLPTFTLRLFDARGRLRESVPLPLDVQQPPPLRMWVLASAPNPELKYLRRWALDAGMALHTQIDAGRGIVLGDAPLPLTADTLARFDLLLLDGRRLQALRDTDWQALTAAIAAGLGVLVQQDAVPTPTLHTRLRSWGFTSKPAASPQQVALLAGETARDGALQAWVLREPDAGAAPLLRDAQGQVLGQWRALGRGRVGLLGLTETYPLVLQGHAAEHAQLWSTVLAQLARPMPQAVPTVPDSPHWQGERIALCRLGADSQLRDAKGASIPLQVDPATGARRCAAVWLQQPGWHVLASGSTQQWLHVLPAAVAPVLQRRQRQLQTQLLAMSASTAARQDKAAPPTRRSVSWPWLAAWLAVAALAWVSERRWNRPTRTGAGSAPA
ncbi:MAG: carboxypeptidase regulatory-like domain-containing protein [Xanthomonadaceae bacterium]|nr:carboxypeptidase regulatory-like domain-containing protein [Xanthomonadaceae bacterium]